MVPSTITAALTVIRIQSVPSARMRSSSAATPTATLTTGSSTVAAGNEISSDPAWNASCWHTNPSTPVPITA